MSCENLCVPEEHLLEVINVILAGLEVVADVTPEVERQLKKWCRENERYMKRKKR